MKTKFTQIKGETSIMRSRTTDMRHSRSITFRLISFLLIILLMQCGLFILFVLFGGTISQLQNNEMDILSERTENRKNYLESAMTLNWGDLESAQHRIEREISNYLSENKLEFNHLNENQTDNLLISLSSNLIELMQRNNVTGTFILLGDQPKNNYPGLYYRDFTPDGNISELSDIRVLRAPEPVVQVNGLTKSAGYSETITISENIDFIEVPFKTIVDNHSSYWSAYSLLAGDLHGLTCTIALKDKTGNPYGILGIEVSSSYLKTILSAHESDETGKLEYFLAVSDNVNNLESYHVAAVSGDIAQSIVNDGTFQINTALLKRNHVYQLENNPSLYAGIHTLSLYQDNKTYPNQSWILVSIIPNRELFAFAHTVKVGLMGVALLSLSLGLILTVFTGTALTNRIHHLSEAMQKIDPSRPATLPRTGITEIDDLSYTIETLSEDVLMSSVRLSRILEITDVPIAAFEIDPFAKHAYYTEGLFNLLGQPEPDHLLSPDEFVEVLEELHYFLCEDVTGTSDALYAIPLRPAGTRWLRYKTAGDRGTLLGVFTDVTPEILEKCRIEFERDYDPLTNLLNRRAFQTALEKLSAQPKYLGIAAMIMMDLDNLKHVNDTYGHDSGDAYIKCAGELLESYGEMQGLASRISGDEFYLFLYGYPDRETLDTVLQQLQNSISNASIFLPNGQNYRLRASMGIAWYPDDSTSLQTLMRYADFAMYQAKHGQKGTAKTFDMQSYEKDSYLLYGREELNRILDENAIDYMFQPIVDCKTGHIYAYEALMRPRSITLSSPVEFLKVARSQSMLMRVEHMTWSIATQRFFSMDNLQKDVKLFINSIPSQLPDPGLLQYFSDCFGEFSNRIVMELTEDDEISQETALQKEKIAKMYGMQIAVDDFGSGYSNDSVLLNTNPDFVKVDIGIIRGIDRDPTKQLLFQNLIGICQQIGARVIAEGIETTEELRVVYGMGADYVQGFLLGKPSFELCSISEEGLRALREIHTLNHLK